MTLGASSVSAVMFTRDSLPDVLRQLAARDGTGELNLVSGSLRAVIHFQQGALVSARFGTRGGEEAFSRILALDGGTFDFVSGRSTNTFTINRSLEHLLSNAVLGERLTQESMSITPERVPFAREADSDRPINLMRIHWQIIKHVDGTSNLAEIAQLVGLNFEQLERPVRDLMMAGLIGLEFGRSAPAAPGLVPVQTSFGEVVASRSETRESPSTAEELGQTAERKRDLFGFLRRHRAAQNQTQDRALPLETAEGSIVGQTWVGSKITGVMGRSTDVGEQQPGSRKSDLGFTTARTQRISVSATFVDAAFLQHLHKLLSTYIGPMAEFALEDAADAIKVKPGQVPVIRLRVFVEHLTQEIMPERQLEFHHQITPIINRYLERVGVVAQAGSFLEEGQ